MSVCECVSARVRLHMHLRPVAAQVEHGITEMVNRVDLVAWQLKLQCPGFKVPLIAHLPAALFSWDGFLPYCTALCTGSE